MRAKHETNSIKEDLWMAITDTNVMPLHKAS